MEVGYLSLETHPDRPGMVRLVSSETDPRTEKTREGSGKTRFILRFKDIDAAFLHAQTAMRRKLADLNNRLYNKTLGEAMGDLQAIQLDHEVVWTDPDISDDELHVMEHEIEHEQTWQHRRDVFVKIIKWVAIALLVFNLLSPLISEIVNGSPS